jgi:hypothetical protein
MKVPTGDVPGKTAYIAALAPPRKSRGPTKSLASLCTPSEPTWTDEYPPVETVSVVSALYTTINWSLDTVR